MPNLNKTILTILVILVILGSLGIIWLLKGNQNPVNSSNTRIIQTPQGQIKVRDYTQSPIQTTNDVFVIEKNSDYEIISYKVDNSFTISLLSKPLKQARTVAENAFINNLNITKTQACALKVSVTTPRAVDDTYSGRELGLSFCSNSVLFP